MTEATQRGITGIGTVAVPVTDQDRAVEFYVERLGFDKHMDAPVAPASVDRKLWSFAAIAAANRGSLMVKSTS